MSVFSSPSFDDHELVAFRVNPTSGLKAIIAIHNTNLGPALGGCRMYPYADDNAALEDVLRLARGMTYKAALAGLPLGGGKSVIIGDPRTRKSQELMLDMAEFIDSLDGLYITAEDSGTGVEDMEIISRKTRHVSGVKADGRFGGDPAPYTAYGVYCGIKAAVSHRFGTDDLQGITVALQGVGSVGRLLCERLIANGATVFVADTHVGNLQRAEALGARVVGIDEALTLDVDVLAPCAMGAVINDATVDNLRCGIVAGAANNQLQAPRHGEGLRERGILYAPDFVINAGGLIEVHHQRMGGTPEQSEADVERIGDTLAEIFHRADDAGSATDRMAEQLAEEIFRGVRNSRTGTVHTASMV